MNLDRILRATFPARPVAAARIVLGIASLGRALFGAPILLSLVPSDAFRVTRFPWWQPNRLLVVTLLAVWVAASIAFTLGWRSRLSGLVLTAAIGLVLALDHQTFSNHLYLMMLMVGLLSLTDPGAALSIDARLGRGEATVEFWPVWLLRIEVSLVLLWSVAGKLNADFLSGRVLATYLRDGVIEFPAALRTPQLLRPASILAVLIEATIAMGLWSSRFRKPVLGIAVLFHLGISLLMAPTVELSVFALVIGAGYFLFVPVPEVAATPGTLSGWTAHPPPRSPTPPAPTSSETATAGSST